MENSEKIEETSENDSDISEGKNSEKSEEKIDEEHIADNPENAEKTFDELEKEADKAFEKEKAELEEKLKEQKESEKIEEKTDENEEKISEEVQNLSQKANEAIQEIIETPRVEPHIEKLYELTNQAKTFMARGLLPEARAAVIEGLSLKKNHRDLNLLLGEVYEKEGNFEKAKLIYKDLAIDHTEDAEILGKLANILIIYKEWEIAYELYKKILSLGGDRENSLFMLVNIAKEIEDFSDVYQYSRAYLKEWPNDKDMLASLSEAQIRLGKRKEAIETLIKYKNLSPYEAVEIQAYIDQLVIEEEKSKNFISE